MSSSLQFLIDAVGRDFEAERVDEALGLFHLEGRHIFVPDARGPDVCPLGLAGLCIHELLAKAHGRDSVAVRDDAQELNENAFGVADRLFHRVFVRPELTGVWFKDIGHREFARLNVVVFQRAVVVGSKEYSCLMVDHIPCLDFLEKTQCFPRWLPGEQTKGAEDTLDFGEQSVMPSGFSPEALPHFQAAYPGKPITEDDLFYYIYGILHSEDYRMRYANNLMKELPRIPRVATYEQFMAFVEAGQELARLHVHFEDVAPYAGVKFEYTKVGQPSYRVTQMKWGKIKGKTGNAAKDKTTLIYNDWITVKNIPLEAQEYVVNKKSALDWVVERACVSIDKASGIVNDFNDYAAEMGSERYPLDLFLKIITVSLETMKIVKTLPKLEIHPLDK